MKIAIVNYGMGNIHSISTTLNYLGINDVLLTSKFQDLANADKIILPGVGSFFKAMAHIRGSNLDVILSELVIVKRKPLLGICLGMQLLGLSSGEEYYTEGLAFIPGIISKFYDKGSLKIPHVGFNQVFPSEDSRLFKNLPSNPDFYFTHSFKMTSDENIGQSITKYGSDFISAFELDNIAGVQFHPELSQKNGLVLLKNFIEKF